MGIAGPRDGADPQAWADLFLDADRRAVAIEVGIRNAGLGLVLIFSFFGGLGGMAVVAGVWGFWDIIAGLALASWWARRPASAGAATEHRA